MNSNNPREDLEEKAKEPPQLANGKMNSFVLNLLKSKKTLVGSFIHSSASHVSEQAYSRPS